jgi:phospholipid transport system substrate-binding protein
MRADRTRLRIVRGTVLAFLLVAVGATTMPLSAAMAQSAADARALVQNLADKGLKVLGDKSITKAKREAEFATLFNQNFHVHTIGVFVLGRHWRRATPEQRKAYLTVFEKLIVKTYSQRLSQYAGEDFRIRGASVDRGVYSVDSVVLREGREPIPLRWLLRKSRSGLRIVDVVIENLSMAQTQRDDFASILRRRGSMDGFIEALKEKVRSLDGG